MLYPSYKWKGLTPGPVQRSPCPTDRGRTKRSQGQKVSKPRFQGQNMGDDDGASSASIAYHFLIMYRLSPSFLRIKSLCLVRTAN
jgi:hypothetical protein